MSIAPGLVIEGAEMAVDEAAAQSAEFALHIKSEPWCVLLASRETAQFPAITAHEPSAAQRQPAMTTRDPLAQTLRRAATVSSRDKIGAVIEGPAEHWRLSALKDLALRNIFVQPKHHGTAYEVLLALLQLEGRVPSTTPIVFLPSDHVVSDEEVMTRSLVNMVEWISDAPRPVYLLGAVPDGPHDQLGYVVPWHDALQMPSSVYEFVEKPDVRQARKLINAGGLWNTFIFGGIVLSILELFRPKFDATITALRTALQANLSDPIEPRALTAIYDRLTPVDFSRDLLVKQADSLNVLRLPRCGWWPLKSPKRVPQISDADGPLLNTGRDAGERLSGNDSGLDR
jgi:mannose-1-phosphate guanylyltransferase